MGYTSILTALLTDNQYALLKAIAYEKSVKSPLAQQFIHTHHLPATSSVKTALRTLEDKMLVSRSANDGYSVKIDEYTIF